MAKAFMDNNFLLNNEVSVKLYHEYAKDMPIYDYHCHLNPKEIAENKRYKNITEIWLGGDHYKWRAMRSNGIDEKYITGNASDYEKFLKWAETMPKCIGNPLYHWTHLELKTYFGIEKLLGPDTADEIWHQCNRIIQGDNFTTRTLINKSNVKVICTTDDPIDSLEYHISIKNDKSFDVKVLPTFRPDKSFNIERSGFIEYLSLLGQACDMKISSFEQLTEALSKRVDFFHSVGCRISDHALDPILYADSTPEEADIIFRKALKGKRLSENEISIFKTQVLISLGRKYSALGWTMQIHMGTIRNNNTRMMNRLGPDTGFDSIGDYSYASSLSKFLDSLDKTNELPKTILYCINPSYNDVLASIIGCFQEGIPGKIQFGSGWWFNDQKDGMIKQMTTLANYSLLSRFVGMLTDSRSFLSYTRHEYFRRILCSLLGEWVSNGEAPEDYELLGSMIKDISYNNSKNYFLLT